MRRLVTVLTVLGGLALAGARSSFAHGEGTLPAGVPAVGQDGGPTANLPPVNPELARLRLKNFLRQAYKRAQPFNPELSPAAQLSLDEALAKVDALTPEQLRAVEPQLGPAIAATRSLDAWAARIEAPAAAGAAGAAGTDGLNQPDGDGEEALRREIDAYLVRFEPYVPLTQSTYPGYGALLAALRSKVQALPARDLGILLDAFDASPSARAVLTIDPANYLGGGGGGATSQAAPQAAKPGTAPDGAQSPDALDAGTIHPLSACNDMAFGPVATVALSAISEAADEIRDLLSDDYMVSTFNIPNPAIIIASIIALPLALVALAAQADLDYFNNCNDSTHHIYMEMHAAESLERMTAMKSLLDDTTKVTDIKRTIANRFNRFDVFAVEFRKITLRLYIERDMLRHGNPRISIFQVPNSMCITTGEHQNCGQLDTVRAIVDDTILNNRAHGYRSLLAETALADGDNQRTLGMYKEAYTRYRYAYQLAVRAR